MIVRTLSRALLGAAVVIVATACQRSDPNAAPKATVLVPHDERPFFADYSPDGSKIAYSRPVEGKGAIWTRNVDGSDPVRLTHGVWDSGPLWSPDGQWLAYQAEDPDFDLMLISASGGTPRVLTSHPGVEIPVGWTADGSGLVYIRAGGLNETWIVSIANGSTRRYLDIDGNVQAAPSPTGGRIAYLLTQGGATTLWVWDSATATHRQLTTEGREFASMAFAWSPDGRALLFQSSRTGAPDLWTANVETGELRQLTTDVRADYNGRWSPDGARVAFISERGGQTDAWMMSAAGGDAVRLTDDRATETFVTWAPDGRTISIITDRAVRQLRSISVDGGESTLLSFPEHAAGNARISPDGNKVLFVSDRSGNADIWVVPIGGGDPTPLTTSAGRDYGQQWSPDGAEIVFVSERGESADIYVMPAVGGEARMIAGWPTTEESQPRWSPDGKAIAFVSTREAQGSDIWVVPTAGGTPSRISRFDATMTLFDWTSDSRSALVKAGGLSSGGFYRVPITGGTPARIGAPASADVADRSPDGAHIAYTDFRLGFGYLGVSPLAGGDGVRLTTDSVAYDIEAEWSPRGDAIAFTTLDFSTTNEDIAIVTWPGRVVRRVTNTPGIAESAPRWTPDGTRLVIQQAEPARALVSVRVPALPEPATP